MKRKWFEEKAETFDPEIQKPASKEYDKHYEKVFAKGFEKLKDSLRPKDVQAQVNYRRGWDSIFGAKK